MSFDDPCFGFMTLQTGVKVVAITDMLLNAVQVALDGFAIYHKPETTGSPSLVIVSILWHFLGIGLACMLTRGASKQCREKVKIWLEITFFTFPVQCMELGMELTTALASHHVPLDMVALGVDSLCTMYAVYVTFAYTEQLLHLSYGEAAAAASSPSPPSGSGEPELDKAPDSNLIGQSSTISYSNMVGNESGVALDSAKKPAI